MHVRSDYEFRLVKQDQITSLRKEMYESLSAPLDGMWDELIHRAIIKGIYLKNTLIGYFCHDHAYTLINFYVSQKWLNRKELILRNLLTDEYFPQAYVCTNHPCFLTAALPVARQHTVYYYLFEDCTESRHPVLPPGFEQAKLVLATPRDTPNIVRFCMQTNEADEAWLSQYTNYWAQREGMYFLSLDHTIIATCELRLSETQPQYADLGAIVSPSYRRQGLGTYLMKKGKAFAYERGRTPICSCRFDNQGSRKMIENAGFVNKHVMFKVRFNM